MALDENGRRLKIWKVEARPLVQSRRVRVDTCVSKGSKEGVMNSLTGMESVKELECCTLRPYHREGRYFELLPYRISDDGPETFDLLTFEPLHNMYLGLPIMLKHCAIYYMSSKRLLTRMRGRTEGPQTILSSQKVALSGCDMLLANNNDDSGRLW